MTVKVRLQPLPELYDYNSSQGIDLTGLGFSSSLLQAQIPQGNVAQFPSMSR